MIHSTGWAGPITAQVTDETLVDPRDAADEGEAGFKGERKRPFFKPLSTPPTRIVTLIRLQVGGGETEGSGWRAEVFAI